MTPALVLWISMSVPFLGLIHFFLYPATAIYLGLNGYEVSWRYRGYHSMAGLQESERAERHERRHGPRQRPFRGIGQRP